MQDIVGSVLEYLQSIDYLEAAGLVFGLLAVWFLIKENIWTWPSGIAYVIISFIIFWEAKLYADFALHFVFLILNIYGWYYWIAGKKNNDSSKVPITHISRKLLMYLIFFSIGGIYIMGYILSNYTDAAVPYWDSATTVLSLSGMWLTARKKIENWHFWLVVDVLATGIYIYKEIYFYATLYLIYIGLAISGYLVWKKSMTTAN